MVSEGIIEKVEFEETESKWERRPYRYQWEKHYRQREL